MTALMSKALIPIHSDDAMFSKLDSLDSRLRGNDYTQLVTSIHGAVRMKWYNTWEAIDTPRFNNVIKAGTLATTSGQLASLDKMPHLYLVLWDETERDTARCRIWVVRPQSDPAFRSVCGEWYSKRSAGEVKSNNFQLHPPRGNDTDIIRNTCGNLSYPLYFSAERGRTDESKYLLLRYEPEARITGTCSETP